MSLLDLGAPRTFETSRSASLQRRLARRNARRLLPSLGGPGFSAEDLEAEVGDRRLEEDFLAEARGLVAPVLDEVPQEPERFLAWFEALRDARTWSTHHPAEPAASTATEAVPWASISQFGS